MYNSMKMLISFKTVVKHHHDMDTVPCDHLKKQITITCLEELYSFKDKVLPEHQGLFFSFLFFLCWPCCRKIHQWYLKVDWFHGLMLSNTALMPIKQFKLPFINFYLFEWVSFLPLIYPCIHLPLLANSMCLPTVSP